MAKTNKSETTKKVDTKALIDRQFEIIKELDRLSDEYGQNNKKIEEKDNQEIGGFVLAVYCPKLEITFGCKAANEIIANGLIKELENHRKGSLSGLLGL